MSFFRPLALLAALSICTPVLAQDARNETVRFAPGTSGATIKARINSDESVRYSLRLSAGQKLDVQLDTSNASNSFNITAPGAEAAMFIGAISGDSATVDIPSSGVYVIDVFLMRNAGRRHEVADYKLTVSAK